MKLLRMVLSLFVICYIPLSFAGVVIEATDGVKILAINEKLNVDADSVEGTIGQNQIVLQYVKRLKDGSKQKVYRSSPFVMKFNLENGDSAKIVAPKLRTYQRADAVFKFGDPEWEIWVEENNVEFVVDALPGRSGFMPYEDLDGLIKEYNLSEGIAVLTPSNTSSGSEPELSDVKALYKSLTVDQQKEFRIWLIDQ
jgi:uncharacterized protein YccT (UPF0319 family)